MKKLFSRKAVVIIGALLILMQLAPAQIFAAEDEPKSSLYQTVYYTTDKGTAEKQDNVRVLTETDYAITELTENDETCKGWYAVSGTVQIFNGNFNNLKCLGNIHLILLDDAHLIVFSRLGTAMTLKTGNSLTITSGSLTSQEIKGTGKLSCVGKDDQEYGTVIGMAGIGYGYGYDSGFSETSGVGDIVINGGEVYAKGGSSDFPGPGIGTLNWNDWYATETSGTLTINGGKLTAVGGDQTREMTYPYYYYAGCSGITYGNCSSTTKGFYVNGGEVIVEASNHYCAVFDDSGCDESIVAEDVAIIGDETTVVDHTDEDITSELRQYNKLHFIGGKGIHYVDENNKVHTVAGKEIDASTTTLDASEADSYGYFYTTKNLEIAHSLNVKGDVKFIIADGTTLTVKGDSSAGIKVDSESAFTLLSGEGKVGTAKLETYGYEAGSGAGIGTYDSVSCGAITIRKCLVTAQGTGSAPGIGGNNGTITLQSGEINSTGRANNGAGIEGAVTINSGKITATGQGSGAGIGNYDNVSVTINNGEVTATGGSNGTGIGGGKSAKGDITINNGTVKATGNNTSAGIGNSENVSVTINGGSTNATGGSNGGTGISGAVTIKTGDVTATGQGTGAGIGNTSGNVSVTINGGNVTATGGADGKGNGGTGIGGGKSAEGEIIINNGDVTATGQGTGAGIGGSGNISVTINAGNSITALGGGSGSVGGAGIGGSNNSGNGLITINGGTINATGGNQSAGIGTGRGSYSTLTGKIISINGGSINAEGGVEGAGIGGGFKGEGTDIVINGGTVNATGGKYGAGIGSGKNGKVGTIQLNSGMIKSTAGASASAIGKGYLGSSGTVLADADEMIWAADSVDASLERSAAVTNNGADLSSALEGKQFVYANHVLNSEGFNVEAYISTNVPQSDRETIENNINLLTITVKDRNKRVETQIALLSRMLEEEYPDKNERLDKINAVLRDESTESVNMGINIKVIVKNSDLSGGENAFIEYALIPTAIASGAISGQCDMTIDDFRNQSCMLEVTMPTCGKFVPGSVSHSNDDGSETYETFSADGTKKFSYNSESKTVTVNINHCSNLRVSAKKSENVNTGVINDTTVLPVVFVLTLLAVAGTVFLVKH